MSGNEPEEYLEIALEGSAYCLQVGLREHIDRILTQMRDLNVLIEVISVHSTGNHDSENSATYVLLSVPKGSGKRSSITLNTVLQAWRYDNARDLKKAEAKGPLRRAPNPPYSRGGVPIQAISVNFKTKTNSVTSGFPPLRPNAAHVVRAMQKARRLCR